MSNSLTNWFDGFAKTAEASGVTDPAEIQKLIAFHKRAELAAKHPARFEEGFSAVTKSAQMYNPFQAPPTQFSGNPMSSGLYTTPSGNYASTDITPSTAHHAVIGGAYGATAGGALGGILGKIFRTGGPHALPAHIMGGKPLSTAARLVAHALTHPNAGRWGILAGLGGAALGASKGDFMRGRYGAGSQVGMTPEGYLNRLEPEVGRMKDIRARLYGAFGPERTSQHSWYMQNQPPPGAPMYSGAPFGQ